MKTYIKQTLFLIITFIFYTCNCNAQIRNDSAIIKDTFSLRDATSLNKIEQPVTVDSLLKKNIYINIAAPPVSLAVKTKAKNGKEFLFYLLGITILLLAFFKVFYNRYFNNIFRVFFNSSLRQNQLTDLLLQAKLPSLIFNIFFIVSAGMYAWLVLQHYHLLKQNDNYILISLSILFVGIIYFGKFCSLKFIGWISEMSVAANQYIFIIFLINKIIGILLIPFIILLAFAPARFFPVIIFTSYCMLGILFLLRYLRTFALLQNQLKINIFHFFLYILGMELLPIMLIYKLIVHYLI